MKAYLKRLPVEIQKLIRIAARIAAENKTPAYLVGGFVRDLFLGIKNLDLDLVIEGDGIKFAESLCASLKGKLIRHRRFGTATVIINGYLKIDVASCRSEFYPHPGHLPVVQNASLKDDLARRDFTVNAMAVSINGNNFGSLLDYFGGRSDLAQKKIRVMHALSFIDDPTRILRAIRFAARYDFRIESKTLCLLREAVGRRILESVQPQRTRDDLILVLKEEDPLKEIRRIRQLAGFKFISPRLVVSAKTYGFIEAIERQISWYKKTFPCRRHLDIWLLYFMGLVDSLSAQAAAGVCKKFALRAGEEKRVVGFKKLSRSFIAGLSKDKAKPSNIYASLEPLSYEAIILLRARYKNPCLRRNTALFFKNYNGMRIHSCGEDLRAMGLEPGPHYRKIFRQVLDARLNGCIKTKKDEIDFIKKLTEKPRVKTGFTAKGS